MAAAASDPVLRPGPRNLITDVSGLRVGNASDAVLKSGATVVVSDTPFTASVDVMGGAPGTRETDLLAPENSVDAVDALVLSGGSALGLDAAAGVADALRAAGRGYLVGDQNVPIVPAAILFDLLNGGDKTWTRNPYRDLGSSALAAAGRDFDLGSHGAGTGATTATLKGGLGSASVVLPSGISVGALVAVNALGSAIADDAGRFWAAPFEFGDEFGGRGLPRPAAPGTLPPIKRLAGPDTRGNTTIAIVATDAMLTKPQARRMAVAAQDGMARALLPSHTPFDGDLVFAAATARRGLDDPATEPLLIGHAAALCLSRAIARGVHAATAALGDVLPCWQERFAR